MSVWAPKRFWKRAEVSETAQGFTVTLDGRAIKTPAKAAFWVPTRTLAAEVAAEWQAQGEKVAPETMPFTRTANSALDKVTPQFAAVAGMLAEYGGSDLLCYRAVAPQELVARQAQLWDPVLAWAVAELGARLVVTGGVMPVAQPLTSLDALAQPIKAQTAFHLSAFHDLVAISGSLVLAHAIARKHLSAETGFALSRLDETWQTEQWGADDEAVESDTVKRVALLHAARFFDLCG
ncbi:ATP12 family chaperone protein [Pseudorhodobacter sp.]|uniref:ATP12 family chaperone protein n=1 Tax=Pseudorhodobacter sp. TaxID=1934400 RepID=UPI002647CA5C|nr:ATP12 family protein [Pseudorhodobacter sp.]MDN5787280.1 ATPase [Pseudorhodobacter sp.]